MSIIRSTVKGITSGVASSIIFNEDVPFVPTDVAGLVGWYDASDVDTIIESVGRVARWDDKSGVGADLTQGGASLRPTYSATTVSNNLPAIQFTDATTSEVLIMQSSQSVRTVYFVMAFRSGTEGVFAGFNTIMSGSGSFGAERIMGVDTASNLIGTSDFTDSVSVNGATPSTTILPLPFSVCKFVRDSAGADNDAFGIGGNRVTVDRAWRGPIGEVLLFSGDVNASDDAAILSYLQNKWGIS